MGRYIERIERCGEDQTVCIAVEHPQSLFIVHDFIVTHNSFLLNGLAGQEHQKSIIFRRESSQTDGLIADGKTLFGGQASYNGSDLEFNWADGRSLKYAGMKDADDWRKHAGRERDFLGFDEAGEFLLVQVSSLMAWLRAPQGQRCRMVLASNPPRSSDGAWLIEWFAPWIDPKFPNPAKHGELRWCVFTDDKTHWVDGPGSHEIGGKQYLAHSRTFIPSRLSDNPDRNTPEYIARLQMTQEPLRSQLINGDFMAGREDQDWQVIPTDWVMAAQARWRPDGGKGCTMNAMGFDPAGGGQDAAVLAPRYGGWYAPLISVTGPQTADGSSMASLIVQHRRHSAAVVVDCGGGYGGAVCLRLNDNGIAAQKFNGANTSTAKAKDGLAFANRRSECYWKLREELDPDQEGGSVIALPPDPELLADLTAPTYKVSARGIQVESKVVLGADGKVIGGLIKRLGRSPGKGDAVAMAMSEGNKAAQKSRVYNSMTRQPQVLLGRTLRR